MADITAIRQALADRVSGLDTPAFQFSNVSPYLLSNPTPPCAYIVLLEEDWPDGNRVRDEVLTFTVNVLIAMNSEVAAQQGLDPLLASTGATSVKEALETPDLGEPTVTLGGLIADLQVTRCRPDRLYPIKGRPDPHAAALGAEWTVLVYPNPE